MTRNLRICCCFMLLFEWAVLEPLSAQTTVAFADPSYSLINQSDNQRSQQLVKVLEQLEKEYSIRFAFQASDLENIRVKRPIPPAKQSAKPSLEEVLTPLLEPLDLTLKRSQVDNYYIIRKKEKARGPLRKIGNKPSTQVESLPPLTIPKTPVFRSQKALEQTISGQVTDLATNEPLPGVNIVAKGTTSGTVTDIDGNYRLTVSDATEALVFSSVGYTTEEIAIDGRSVINLQLAPDIQSLSEIVVVGYGEQSRRKVSSAIATVDAREIQNLPSASFDNLIQGRAAGVQVTQGTGQPGGAMTVRIRGNTSIEGGNEPLYVIDGIQISGGSVDGLSDGGAGTNPLAAINPNDIESIQILKDAASTSIYGARGANGVVLITTKRGTRGKPQVNLNYYTGFQTVVNKLSQINSAQYRAYVKESYANVGRVAPNQQQYRATDSLNSFFNNDTYWQDELFETAPISNYEISASGAGEKINYYLSTGYFDQDGIVLGSKYDRLNVRANVDYQATDRIKFGNSFTYANSQSNRTTEGAQTRGVFWRTATRFPVESPYFDNGELRPQNPINTLLRSFQQTKQNDFFGNVYGEVEVLEGLKFRSSIGLNYNILQEERFYPSTIRTQSTGTVLRTADARMRQSFNWINTNTLTYDRVFGDHSLNAVLGIEPQKTNVWAIQAESSLAPNDLVRTVNSGAQADVASTFETYFALVSYFARVNYDFKGKYLVGVTGRYDGSSRFGRDNRYGFFPSASVAWRVSEEPIFQSSDLLSDLKLRASYGVTGNQDINNFVAQGLYASGYNYLNYGGIAPTGNGLPNRTLSWESTAQTNIGLDISLYKARVTLLADYFLKQTDNLLFGVDLPSSAGYDRATVNLGKMKNSGFEFNLSTVNVEGAFQWRSNLNISFIQNEITELPDGKDIIVGGGAASILREGEPLGSFYGWQQLRVFPTDESNVDQLRLDRGDGLVFEGGDVEFLDLDENGFIDGNDRVIIGTANPDFTGGFTNDFSYKGFNLNVFFVFSQGNDIYNAVRRDRDAHRLGTGAGASTDVLNRWREPGDVTDFPKVFRGDVRKNGRQGSSYWVEDGSYARLKNVTLSYTLPRALTERIAMQQAKFYVTGQNLYTWTNYTGYDPEVVTTGSNANSGSRAFGYDWGFYPLARTIIFGANLTF